MSIEIRKATVDDLSAVIVLLREFAEFENLTDRVEITEEKLSKAVFGSDAFVECLVAANGDKLVAYGLLYPVFLSFRGQKGMFLEDFFITKEYRRSGLGERMFREFALLARDRGCERLDLMVLDWNTPAISFYEKQGGIRDDAERHFRFTDETFRRLCS
jgi:ribosomal protein S18 acetylase RimI-like enzyme